MPFAFTEEHEMLRKMVREFAQKEVAPIAEEIDKESRFPKDTIQQMAELGLFGVPVPVEMGGVGAGYVGYCLVVEELAKACMSHATIMGAHTSLCALPLAHFGSNDQKERIGKKLASGEWLGAFALTEPWAGSDAANIRAYAVKMGDEWILNGTKTWITNGAEADVVVVIAITDPEKGARGGITAFMVEKDFEGYSVGQKFDKMGIRATSSTELNFDDCIIPEENVLGGAGNGFKVAMATLDSGRMTLGAGCVGGALEAMRLAVDYAKEREAFGGPIAEKQAIQFKIADMAVDIHAARLMVYDLAFRMDEGERVSRDSAIVKLFCSEMSRRVVNEALQIHGGYGYSKEYAVERMYRDQRVTEIFEGTSEIQRLIIAEDILKKGLPT